LTCLTGIACAGSVLSSGVGLAVPQDRFLAIFVALLASAEVERLLSKMKAASFFTDVLLK